VRSPPISPVVCCQEHVLILEVEQVVMSSLEDQKYDSDQIAAIRQAVKALNAQREALESESSAIESELTARNPEQPDVPPMGIDTPLTDAEGFPRNDIDVFRARSLRNRLAIIRTDHKNSMKQIEESLKQLALLQVDPKAEAAELEARKATKPKPKFDPVTGKWVVRNWDGTISGSGSSSQDATRSFDDIGKGTPIPSNDGMEIVREENIDTIHATTDQVLTTPGPTVQWTPDLAASTSGTAFARVESVAPESPAASAGLQAQDEIVAFGSVREFIGDSIAQLVQQAASRYGEIDLHILRGGKKITLRLAPRPWKGSGLLGCHIVPVER
jgi:membrane-associated protease RseP (regulator of RpoE activity)